MEATDNNKQAKPLGIAVDRWVRPLALLLVCLLTACYKAPVATTGTDNAEIKVERLFDHDGCTVYRFSDGGTRYFVKCRDGSTRTEWSERYPCGKSICHRDLEIPGA